MIIDREIKFDTRDEFERRDIASRIKSLLDSPNGSSFFPVMIDGDWGAGKTEFLFKLINFILDEPEPKKSDEPNESDESKEAVVVETGKGPYFVSYINSFTADYYDDPFMIIVREIYTLLSKEGHSKDLKGFLDIVKKMTPSLVGTAVNFTLSSIPYGQTIKDGLQVVAKLSKALEKAEETAYESRLKQFLTSANEFERFRDVLQKTIKAVGGKYVLIIDELDRCKPDYALKLLEMVKHLFDIDGLFIIFGANSKYLEGSIVNSYLHKDSLSESYLAKFYNLKVTLTTKKEVGVPDELNRDTNYLYFKDNYWMSEGFPESFSKPFEMHEKIGGMLEKHGGRRIPPFNGHFGDVSDEINSYFRESLESLKSIFTALLGDLELRQREKIKQNIRLLYELDPQILQLDIDVEGFLPKEVDARIRDKVESLKQMLEGPLAILIGISMVRDNSPLIGEILSSGVFIYKPSNVNLRDIQGKSMGVNKIKKYLEDKHITLKVIESALTGFIGRSSQSSLYDTNKNHPSDWRDQEYPLKVLIKTIKSLSGLQVR